MKRIATYALLFPLICVLFLFALAAIRSSTTSAAVLMATFLIMLLPATIVGVVDAFFGRWSIAAGAGLVPLTVGAALYSLANPRVLESLYFGLAGAVAAAVCSWLSGRKV